MIPQPKWRGDEPCRDDPELPFSTDAADQARQRAVCHGCPSYVPCQAYALAVAVDGMWGGMTVAARNRMRRREGLPDPEPLESVHPREKGIRRRRVAS